MASDPLNANPTILNASDLPTRRQGQSSPGPHEAGSLFTGLTPLASQLVDPFGEATSSSPAQSDSDDDGVVETIDEQEIYGTCLYRVRTGHMLALPKPPPAPSFGTPSLMLLPLAHVSDF